MLDRNLNKHEPRSLVARVVALNRLHGGIRFIPKSARTISLATRNQLRENYVKL